MLRSYAVIALFCCFLSRVLACGPRAASPVDAGRANARAAILTVAEATRQADTLCAAVARDKRDVRLAAECSTSYDKIRVTLLGLAGVIDRWDDAASGRETVVCSVHDAADELASMTSKVLAAEENKPGLAVVSDAVALVGVLGKCSMNAGDASHE